jgi:hypothetical protein
MAKKGRKPKVNGERAVVMSFSCSPDFREELREYAYEHRIRNVSDFIVQATAEKMGRPIPTRSARVDGYAKADAGVFYEEAAGIHSVCPNCGATTDEGYRYTGHSIGFSCARCGTAAMFDEGRDGYEVFRPDDYA